jgi:hypothetical protein
MFTIGRGAAPREMFATALPQPGTVTEAEYTPGLVIVVVDEFEPVLHE